MKPLTTYWLCRTTGAATEGPFTFGQIKAMYQTGAINAEALICPNGEEEWTEARWILEEAEEIVSRPIAPAPQVVYVHERKDKRGTCGCMTAVACMVVLLIGLRIMSEGGVSNTSSTDHVIDLNLDVKRWVRSELADKDAEVMLISAPVEVNGEFYRIVRLRGKNAFGGPVVNDFVSSSKEKGSISWMESLKEFKETAKYDKTLGADGAAKVGAALGFTLPQ
jgi:hypothetical protein